MPALGSPAAASAAPCAGEATDQAAALAMARRCDIKVEALSKRTETTVEVVNPDGTATIEQYAYPQRARMRDGSWAALDPTLVANADGSVSAKASTLDLTLSGGGSSPLVSGKGFSLSWPVALPKPVTSGRVATYPEVYPGVDLVVTALEIGFSEVLVVKNRAAAQNPALRQVRLGTAGARWETADGGLRAVDASGNVVLAAQKPLMWDSSRPSAPRGSLAVEDWSAVQGPERSTVAWPGKAARKAPIGLAVSGGQLTLAPDPAMLNDPKIEYPLYIDPTVVYTSWAMISSTFPDQEYWTFDKTDCPNDPATGNPYNTECAKVGTYSVNYRSMFQFATSPYEGLQILGAVFSIDLLHSTSCSNQPTQIHLVDKTLGSTTNWNNTASLWGGSITSVSNQSCNQARKGTDFTVTSTIVAAEAGSATRTTFGLRSTNEAVNTGSSSQWKKFDAKKAKLVVTANTIPTAPASVTVDNKACPVGASRPFIKTDTPTVRAYFHDGDGNSMTGTVNYARLKTDGTYSSVQPVTKASLPSSTTQPIDLPKGLTGGDVPVATGDWDKDGHADVVSRDGLGDLYLYPGSATLLTERVKFGNGWSSYTFAGMADWDKDGHQDLVVKDSAGVLWLYVGNSTRNGPSGSTRVQIGSGWTPYTFGGVTDWDKDSHQDMVTIDSAGVLWLYPGESTRTNSTQARVQIGSGWTGYTPFGTLDYDKDGNPDIIVRDPAGSLLWLYIGAGARAAYTGTPYRFQIGTGWTSYLGLMTPDFNADGNPDVIAKQPNVTDWFAYPGTGARTSVGARWTIASAGIGQGSFAVQVKAADANATSGYSAWCEFTVDTIKPAVPTITPDIYLEGTDVCAGGPCGSVGKTGRFNFSSSADVTQFRYWWNGEATKTLNPVNLGDPVTLDWTPTSGGPKILNVTAIDRAGNEETKAYQFIVKAESPAIASWKLNDGAGSTQVFDDSGNNRHATVVGATLGTAGRVLGGDTAMSFDGSGDYATTGSSVLSDTRKSFSVSAWVKLDDTTSGHEILSQGGVTTGAFILESHASGVWKFTTTLDDDAGTTETYPAAVSVSAPRVGVWTHLVGVYDSAAKELRLYVNGQLENVKTAVTTWDANGPTRIGGYAAAPFRGSLSDIRIWDRAVFPKEIADASAAVNVGKYRFDFGYDPSVDESGFFHDLDYYGGATIDPTSYLKLDGVDDHMATIDQVVHTDQSFTVSARTRLGSVTGHDIILSQDSTGTNAGFFLYFQNDNGGQWVFGIRDSSTSAGGTYAAATAVTPTSWHEVTGVFDAQRKQIQLFVDGVLKSTVAMNAAWVPWDANGAFQIGRGLNTGVHTSYLHGDIDDVYAYQGIGPVKGPLGQWKLNDPAASAAVADSSGNAQAATVYGATLGVTGRSSTAAQFNGTSNYIGAPSVLDTSKSFSVAAWVKLDSKGANDRTVVSQVGTHTHAFYLQFDAASDRWRLEMPDSDSDSPTWYHAQSTSVPQIGVWTHLAATYDSGTNELKLYVNGVLESTLANVHSFNAAGELRIGRSYTWWHGAIDEVNLWNRVLSPAEIALVAV